MSFDPKDTQVPSIMELNRDVEPFVVQASAFASSAPSAAIIKKKPSYTTENAQKRCHCEPRRGVAIRLPALPVRAAGERIPTAADAAPQ